MKAFLTEAIQKKDIEAIKILLKENSSCIQQQDPETGDTPLYLAVREGHKEIVSLLLEHKADVSILNKKKETALHVAASQKDPEIIKLILSRLKPVLKAVKEIKEKSFLDFFPKIKPELEVRDNEDHTPLHRAAKLGHFAVCHVLLESGAQQSIVDLREPYTALFYIAQYKVTEKEFGEKFNLIQQCVEKDEVDINQHPKFTLAPIHILALNNEKDAVGLLLKHHAKIKLNFLERADSLSETEQERGLKKLLRKSYQDALLKIKIIQEMREENEVKNDSSRLFHHPSSKMIIQHEGQEIFSDAPTLNIRLRG